MQTDQSENPAQAGQQCAECLHSSRSCCLRRFSFQGFDLHTSEQAREHNDCANHRECLAPSRRKIGHASARDCQRRQKASEISSLSCVCCHMTSPCALEGPLFFVRAPQRFAAAPSRKVRVVQRSLFAHPFVTKLKLPVLPIAVLLVLRHPARSETHTTSPASLKNKHSIRS